MSREDWARGRVWLMAALAAVLFVSHAAGQSTQPASADRLIRRSSEPATASVQPEPAAGTSSGYADLQRVVLALALVIALVLILRWAGRRMLGLPGASRAGSVIRVVGRVPIAPRQHLLLVQVGSRLILLGDGGGQLNTLCQITEADEVAALLGQLRAGDSSSSFAAMFQRNASTNELEQSNVEAAGNDDPSIEETKRQLSGLSEKIRNLASQFRGA